MYYLTGDIHGCLDNLDNLYKKIKNKINPEDTLIFLGDFIDRGPSSYDVIEYLLKISENNNAVFLKGNHEDMFLKYKSGQYDAQSYFDNGGYSTVRSYRDNGNVSIPNKHQAFFSNLKSYYETDDFIAVHAGLNPDINDFKNQSEYDMLWIRETFFKSGRAWDKSIIFGHTPCSFLHGKKTDIYFNSTSNIIGIDTGACYGGLLSCLRWPDRMIFQG